MPRKLDDILAELDKPAEAPKAEMPSFDVDESINRNAQLHGIPLEIAHAMIQQESGKKADAQSHKGAFGYGQLMPATAKELGVDINDPEQNIEGSMRYLKMMYDKYGDFPKALAAYNAGPGAVDKYGGIPPFKETQNYVTKILGNAKAPVETPVTEPVKEEKKGPRKLDDILNELGDVEEPMMPLIPGEELAGPPQGAPPTMSPEEEALLGAQEPAAQPTSFMDTPAIYTGLLGGMQSPQALLDQAQSFAEGLGKGTGYNKFIKPLTEKIADPIASALLGQDVAPIRQAQEQSTAQAVEENPLANWGGEMTSILAGPVGKITAPMKAATLLGKAAELGVAGALQGASYDVLSNNEATPQTVAENALLGGVLTPVLAGGLGGAVKGIKGFGKAVLNFAFKNKNPEVAEHIATKIGPTKSRGALESKNNALMKEAENGIKSVLSEHSNKTVNMKLISQDPRILKGLESLDNVEERKIVTNLLDKLAKYEKRGNISLEEANKFKQDLYKRSNFSARAKKYNTSEFQKSVALRVKEAIEDVTKDPRIKEFNKLWGNAIETQKMLEAMNGPYKLRTYIEAASVLTNPYLLAPVAAGHIATSTPGATTINALSNKIGTGVEKLSPDIITLINTLLPEKLRK